MSEKYTNAVNANHTVVILDMLHMALCHMFCAIFLISRPFFDLFYYCFLNASRLSCNQCPADSGKKPQM